MYEDCIPNDKLAFNPFHGSNRQFSAIDFASFAEAGQKTKPLRISEMFAKHVNCIHGITVERSKALIDKYPVPRMLDFVVCWAALVTLWWRSGWWTLTTVVVQRRSDYRFWLASNWHRLSTSDIIWCQLIPSFRTFGLTHSKVIYAAYSRKWFVSCSLRISSGRESIWFISVINCILLSSLSIYLYNAVQCIIITH